MRINWPVFWDGFWDGLALRFLWKGQRRINVIAAIFIGMAIAAGLVYGWTV